MVGRERPRVAGVETKTTGPGTIVQGLWIYVGARDGANDLLEGVVEGEGPVEGVEEEALGDFRVVVAHMVDIDYQPPLLLLDHQGNVGAIASCMLVICAEVRASVCGLLFWYREGGGR